MFRKKIKKFTAVFLVLISLVIFNIGFFTVNASANVADVPAELMTLGAPVTLNYWTLDMVEGVINRPNCYMYNDGSYSWVEGTTSSDYYTFIYNVADTGAADVFLDFNSSLNVSNIRIDSPILFTSSRDLTTLFNFNIGLHNPSDALGSSLTSIVVTYTYSFVTGSLENDNFILYNDIVQVDKVYNLGSGLDIWVDIPLFNYEVLTPNVISNYSSFQNSNGNSFCYLTSASIDFPGIFIDQLYFEPLAPSALMYQTTYNSFLNERFKGIYEADTYSEDWTEIVVFEDLSWTDWLVNALSGFMNFELIPGLSFAGMLGLLVGMSLFIVFLKVFAGG